MRVPTGPVTGSSSPACRFGLAISTTGKQWLCVQRRGLQEERTVWMTWPVGSMKERAGTPTCVQTVTGAQIWARPSVSPSSAGSPGWAAGRSRTPGEEGSGEVEPGAAGGDSAASCSVVLAPDGRWHMWLQEQSILWKSWFPFSAAVGPQSVPEPPWSCMSSCGRWRWQRGLCRGLPELIGGGEQRTPVAV